MPAASATPAVATGHEHPSSPPRGPSSSTTRIRTRDALDAESAEAELDSPRRAKVARTHSSSSIAAPQLDAQNAPSPNIAAPAPESQETSAAELALQEELECGMCAGVFIDPVALNGCGHVFCGSCVTQWIASLPQYPASLLPGDPVPEPICCPQCRHAPVHTATPSRMAKTMVALLLSMHPELARPPNEHKQAEAIYSAVSGEIKFPVPPPPPRALQRNEFWRPCRSCYPAEGQWKCPIPVPRFDEPSERDSCLRADGLCPDGHRLCAGCDRLSPASGPSSSTCGICGEGFCGDSAMGCECVAVSKSVPTPQFANLAYILEDCPTDMLSMAFKDNWTEMAYLGAYLGADTEAFKAADIYRSILTWLRTPEAVESGGIIGLMNRADINLRLRTGMADEMQLAISAVGEEETEAKICGGCADEILCAGLLEWWMRELAKPEVASSRPAAISGRPNCKHGRKCTRQDSEQHAKKFNHICEPMPEKEASQIHQDDTPAIQTNEPTNALSPSGSSSDDEDESEKPTYTTASTQYEANPEGSVVIGRSTQGIQAVWKASEQLPVASSSSLPAPALAISNLVNSPAGRSVAGSSAADNYHGSFSTLRVSGSPSTSLVATFPNGWNGRREHTPPPLGALFGGNTTVGPSANPSPAVGATSKLSLPPVSRPPSHFGLGGDASAILTGTSSHLQRSTPMDLDP
ncbi:hypothetical protein Q8F55_000263 [Vanrija albida]|uniref:RING-type domain-containing protein n=1 Tax=Vanrija albida TaxID=181172 RepID=A0ABR3QDC1_9TREE